MYNTGFCSFYKRKLLLSTGMYTQIRKLSPYGKHHTQYTSVVFVA